jgi:hypothetical protein
MVKVRRCIHRKSWPISFHHHRLYWLTYDYQWIQYFILFKLEGMDISCMASYLAEKSKSQSEWWAYILWHTGQQGLSEGRRSSLHYGNGATKSRYINDEYIMFLPIESLRESDDTRSPPSLFTFITVQDRVRVLVGGWDPHWEKKAVLNLAKAFVEIYSEDWESLFAGYRSCADICCIQATDYISTRFVTSSCI